MLKDTLRRGSVVQKIMHKIRVPDTPEDWRGLQEQSLIDGEWYTLSIFFLCRYTTRNPTDIPMSAEVAIFNDDGFISLSPYPDSWGDDGMYRANAGRILRAMEMFRKAESHEDILKVLMGLVDSPSKQLELDL
jgi:hypothetical protein